MSRRSPLGRVHPWLVVCACSFDASGEPTGTTGGSIAASSTGTTASDSAADGSQGTASVSMGELDGGPTSAASSSDGQGDGSTEGSGGSSSEGPAESSGDGSSSGGPTAICGNGMIEIGETCETNDLGGAMCSDLGGEFIGEPTCAGCQIDTGPCCVQDGVPCIPFGNDCCNGCGIDFSCG